MSRGSRDRANQLSSSSSRSTSLRKTLTFDLWEYIWKDIGEKNGTLNTTNNEPVLAARVPRKSTSSSRWSSSRSRTSTARRRSTRASGGGSTPTSPPTTTSGVVQFTPPGSGCSVQFGTNITSAAPGSAQGCYLIVSDIEAARDELVARGVEVSEVFHDETGRSVPARRTERVGPADRRPITPATLVRRVQRSRRQRLAAAGDHDPAARAGSTPPTTLRVRRGPGERAAPRGGRPRRAREAHRRGRRQLAGLVRRVHGRASRRRGAAEMSRLRRHRARRRFARRALRGRAGRGRPARRGRRARAGRRRVLLLGVHPVEDAAAPGRGRARRARGGGDRGGRRRGGAGLARLHGLQLLRRRPGAWLADNGIDLLRGTGRLAGAGVGRGRRRRGTRPSTSSSPPAPSRSSRRCRACASSTGVWTNREATA